MNAQQRRKGRRANATSSAGFGAMRDERDAARAEKALGQLTGLAADLREALTGARAEISSLTGRLHTTVVSLETERAEGARRWTTITSLEKRLATADAPEKVRRRLHERGLEVTTFQPTFQLVIPGGPRTKKNNLRRSASGGVFHGGGYSTWEKQVALLVRAQWSKIADGTLGLLYVNAACALIVPVNMGALVYRARADHSDLLNHLAAVSDVLERAGVVADDKLITSLDGCRLLLDRVNPRVEVTLTVGA